MQREVEVLHDQLLARFSADKQLGPRDVIVMVPDINAYTPHIEAVFGQVPKNDPRYRCRLPWPTKASATAAAADRPGAPAQTAP